MQGHNALGEQSACRVNSFTGSASFQQGFSFFFFIPFKAKHINYLTFVALKVVSHNIIVNAVSDGVPDSLINSKPLMPKQLVVVGKSAVLPEGLADAFQGFVFAGCQVVNVDNEFQLV